MPVLDFFYVLKGHNKRNNYLYIRYVLQINMTIIDIHVTNFDFYIAIEWNIIKAMRKVEKALKNVAWQAVADVDIKVNRDRVLEGYYGMTLEYKEKGLDNLANYFFAIKSLQEGKPNGTEHSEALRRLDDFYHSHVFGMGPERPTVYYPKPQTGWDFKDNEARFISGIVDGIYLAITEKRWSALNHNTQAIVQKAIELQREGKLGINLVALAALVDEKEHNYNGQIDPVCLTCSMFTTILSRAGEPCAGGAPKYKYYWDVDKEVEELGTKVIEGYNGAFARVLQDSKAVKMIPFDKQNIEACKSAKNDSYSLLGAERVVKIDSDENDGNLHWAVRWENGRYGVLTFTSPEIVDPAKYKLDTNIIDKYNPTPAVRR